MIGLIERERLYFQFSQLLWFDVYDSRPIAPLVTREAMVVDGVTPIEGVKEPIADRYPQAISSGFAIVERNRYLGIGTMTALLDKTVDVAHRRAIELEEAHRKAEIASEAKSRFLAAMRHKLRAPLNAIIGFAELLLMRDVERMEQDRCRGYITDIRNSGAHLLALIDDVLDYSKPEADHLPLAETIFDLGQFLHDGLRRVRAQAEAGGVTLRLLPPPAIALKGDERRLRQSAWSIGWPTPSSSHPAARSPCGRDGRGQGHRDPDPRYRLRHSAGPARSGTLRLDSAIRWGTPSPSA